jgi:vacuolar protein sorting-associated protein 54
MLRDAEHFKTRIGGLDGAGDTGDFIVNLVKGKNVPKTKAPSPPPAEKEEAATNGDDTTPKASLQVDKTSEDAKDEKNGDQ